MSTNFDGNFDGNAWYQLTETRVDFNSSLQVNGNSLFFGGAGAKTNQFWQILPLGNSQYALRNKANALRQQLGVCYTDSEKDPSKTQPCMVDAFGEDSQKWTIESWGDGTYKFNNVGNGTGYNLDWHPGHPGFLSSATAATPRQPAQHWMFSSLSAIDDGAFSTTFTDLPTSTSTGATTSKTNTTSRTTPASASATTTGAGQSAASQTASAEAKSSSGLSAGAAAGIGVTVGVIAVLAVIGAIFLILRRRKRQRQAKTIPPAQEIDGNMSAAPAYHMDYKYVEAPTPSAPKPAYEMEQPPVAPVELAAVEQQPRELGAGKYSGDDRDYG